MKTFLITAAAALTLVSGAAFAQVEQQTTTRTIDTPTVVVAPRAGTTSTTVTHDNGAIVKSRTVYHDGVGVAQQKTVTHTVGPVPGTVSRTTTTTNGY